MGKKDSKQKHSGGLLGPDGSPLSGFSEDPKDKPKGKKDTPIDKICQIISDEDERLLNKIQSEIEELGKAVKEREEFFGLLQRTQSDFMNYQKRIKREKENWDKYQDEAILKELLPALDNLDRTLEVKCESDDAKCILDGVDLTKREVLRILEKRGLKKIKTVKEKFDPSLHEALGTIETDEYPEGVILEEARPGFILHDRVIRAAQVRVSTPPKPEEKE